MRIGSLAKLVGKIVAQFGNTITLANGDVITAMVNEKASDIERYANASDIEAARGRTVLFRMTPADAAKVPNGVLLPYDGVSFALRPSRSTTTGDEKMAVSFLGAAGGYAP